MTVAGRDQTKTHGPGSVARRRAMGLFAGAALGELAGLLGSLNTDADNRRNKTRHRRNRRRNRRDRRGGSGKVRYPDLRTEVPSELCLDQLSDGTHVVRFTNAIWNDGEGRLEIEGNVAPTEGEVTELHQNLYDQPAGGSLTQRRQVNGRIEFHAAHDHYHFADFARYRLLKRDDAGQYQPVGEGDKRSFCIVDNFRRANGPGFPRRYDSCVEREQGLMPGWVDRYARNLADQWVVIGPNPLPDGEYALESIADPMGLLDEGGGEREENNGGIEYFRAEDIPPCPGFFDLP